MDKLDQLLTAYIGDCIEEEAAHFLSLDVSGIEYNETVKQKLLASVGRSRPSHRRYATAKLILIACLVALSLIFTACITIPEIRAVLWRIVLDPREDHIIIRFEPETSEMTTAATVQTQASTTNAAEPTESPKVLEQFAYIAALPPGYTVLNEMSTKTTRIVDYGNAAGQLQWRLSQSIIHTDGLTLDYEEGDILTHIKVTAYPAILIRYPEKEGYYSLAWRDDLYSYNLYGYFASADDISAVAESVELGKRAEVTAQQTTDSTHSYPQTLKKWAYVTYLPKGYAQIHEDHSQFSHGVEYRDSTTDMLFGLIQLTISDDDEWMLDYEEGDILSHTENNGYPAVMIEYPDDPTCFAMTWQDDQYSYALSGYFPSKKDFLKIAESVKLKEIPAQTTTSLTTATETTPAPPKKIEKTAYVDRLPSGWSGKYGSGNHIATITNYFDASGALRFVLSQLVLSANDHLDSENKTMISTTVLDSPALLMQDTAEPNIYTLTWTDGSYNYTLYGIFDSVDQLMHFAESVKLK